LTFAALFHEYRDIHTSLGQYVPFPLNLSKGNFMNGAEIVLKTAAQGGVDVCFTNPGTTELPLVAAFDTVSGIRPVLGLFEGCCSGAADGYGRMTGNPAMTLFHLGPGLGNAVANLHNARRARTPVFNVIGDHASWHRDADAPLTMDIAALAATVSEWTHTASSVKTLSQDTAQGITAARQGAGASLILPQDVQWKNVPDPEITSLMPRAETFHLNAIEKAATLLKSKKKCVLILGGSALRTRGLQHASQIAAATGCSLLSETFPAHMERGRGLPDIPRIPYAPDHAYQLLAVFDVVILIGTREPVAFFGYKGGRSRLIEDSETVLSLNDCPMDADVALEHLADAIDIPLSEYHPNETREMPALPQGALNAKKVSQVLAALQPENAIIVDESITSAVGYYKYTASSPCFSLLTLTGGSIGMGLPLSIGAALACPDRPVIDFQADGSAIYTIQALWTQARESLNITTLLCANRSYKILEAEFKRAQGRSADQEVLSLMELKRPDIDWVGVSQGMGVPAEAVDTAEELAEELARALAEPGPNLIQMNL
jgi:acetolactate synthase-1/2/3 large subunit